MYFKTVVALNNTENIIVIETSIKYSRVCFPKNQTLLRTRKYSDTNTRKRKQKTEEGEKTEEITSSGSRAVPKVTLQTNYKKQLGTLCSQIISKDEVSTATLILGLKED